MSSVKFSGDVDCPVVPHLNSGCGFPAPNAEIFFLEPYATLNVAGMDFVIGKTSIIAALVSLIVAVFFLAAARPRKMVPGKLQSIGEQAYLFVRDQIAREVIGKDGDRFVPFLGSLFFFIWISNLMGVIPGAQFPIMSSLAFPSFLNFDGLHHLHVSRYEAPRTN